MNISTTTYNKRDYNDVIRFLGYLYQLNPDSPYWLPSRWEYAAYLVSPLHLNRGKPNWTKYIQIWKDGDKIVGIVNSENPDENVFIHLDPKYLHLKEEMIDWAEENIDFGGIRFWIHDKDAHTEEILKRSGYKVVPPNTYLNWCELDTYSPRITLPDDYVAESLDEEETYLDSKRECIAKAFGSEVLSPKLYKFMQSAPSYKRTLDLYIRKGKQVVSMCTVWLDEKNDHGYIEPVGTHPDYQKRGLGKAVVNYAMKKLKDMKISRMYVGAYGDDRKTFYYKSGFTNSIKFKAMEKNA